MKKSIAFILALATIIGMTACGNSDSSSKSDKDDGGALGDKPAVSSKAEEESSSEAISESKAEESSTADISKSDDSKTEKESENFLDIIPLIDPSNQVGSDGIILDATISDSIEEGIQAFESLDAYSKVIKVDDTMTYESLKSECDDKALIAVTFDVNKEILKDADQYYYNTSLNNLDLRFNLGNVDYPRFDIIYSYFVKGDKKTTVIGKPKFENNTVNVLPYAVNIGEVYVPDKDPIPTVYFITYTPTFVDDYEFNASNGASLYYTMRENSIFETHSEIG